MGRRKANGVSADKPIAKPSASAIGPLSSGIFGVGVGRESVAMKADTAEPPPENESSKAPSVKETPEPKPAAKKKVKIRRRLVTKKSGESTSPNHIKEKTSLLQDTGADNDIEESMRETPDEPTGWAFPSFAANISIGAAPEEQSDMGWAFPSFDADISIGGTVAADLQAGTKAADTNASATVAADINIGNASFGGHVNIGWG